MDGFVFKVALIGVAGVASQWLAWRLRLPAIVLLLFAGLLLGPGLGALNPAEDFGEIFKPLVAMAVAIILFEGGITLKFAEIRHTGLAVRRLVVLGAPIGWALGTLAAHYAAGLDWPAAFILGGLFIVTGPTVIMPLLRQAKLAKRPASLLRWEAIVNDPIGALFAVFAFEIALVLQAIPSAAHGEGPTALVIRALFALALAVGGGYLLARAIVWMFNARLAPEYLKSPILLIAVLAGYEMSQLALEESGLLTVTVMGLTIANSKLASLSELKRFKEIITVLLVSGVFIMLTATLNAETVAALDWSVALYVGAMLFLVRPATIFLSTIGAGLTLNERILVAWIAPRGVVAVAVAGFFGAALTAAGSPDGVRMTAIAFAMVFATVLLHGFTLGPLARALGLASKDQPGVLFVGAGPFTTAFGVQLKEAGYPVLIADQNWMALREARQEGLETFYGEILSETAEHSVDFNPYGLLIAATVNDAYNTLVCTDYAPELGRGNVRQLYPIREPNSGRLSVSHELGGAPLFTKDLTALEVRRRMAADWRVKTTRLSGQFDLDQALHENGADGVKPTPLALIRADGRLVLASPERELRGAPEDRVIMLAPPRAEDPTAASESGAQSDGRSAAESRDIAR
ncbi:MAG: sodium:proton antiporter [Pseudomonadota bacterium]